MNSRPSPYNPVDKSHDDEGSAQPSASDGMINAAYETADDRWCTDGDPMAEGADIFFIKPDGSLEFHDFSPATMSLHGLSESDRSPQALFASFVQSPAEAARHQALVAVLPQTLHPVSLDLRIRGQDRRLRWIRQTLTPRRLPDGTVEVTGRYRDVTREKLGEDQLELLRTVVTKVTDAIRILQTTPDGITKTIYVNPALERLTGWSAKELIASDGASKKLAPDADGDWTRLLDMAEKDGGSSIEVELTHRDGRRFWAEVTPCMVEHRPDGARRWALISRNIDERRRAQDELLQAKEAAEVANAAKSEFLANMSHEIRTPMNGVLGMIGLLMDTPLTDQQRQYARAVEISAEALLTIINDILDIAKLEAGRVDLESIDFDLVELVENAALLMSARASERGLDLAIDIDPAAESMLRGDPNRLRQVILNLTGNAIKFTDEGCVSIRASVVEAADDGASGQSVRFAVVDSGIGMDEAARGRLFHKFSQADTSITRRFGGTGLGLAISKQLVELMGGRIGVDSTPGQGSTFWFEIPLIVSSAPRNAAKVDTSSDDFSGLRALVVDDIALNLEIVVRQLARLGIDDIDLLEDATEVISLVRRAQESGNPYDVIFLDQMMPGRSGESLASELRSISDLSAAKLVLVTSAGTDGRLRGAASPFDLVFDKPLRRGDLQGGLVTLFGRAQPRGQPIDQAKAPEPGSTGEGEEAVETGCCGLRVLLVEDHKINQQFALAVLVAGGHEADLAENGFEAVEAVQRANYDVVLMDVHMPLCDGLEATRLIRALAEPKRDVIIIALTADAMNGTREQYIAAGMDDCLSKPVKPAELLAKLAQLQPRSHRKPLDGFVRGKTSPPLRAGR